MAKNMALTLIIGMVMVLSAFSVLGEGSGEVADTHRVVVSLLNQDPDPVSTGNFVDLRFKFENYGLKEARGIEVMFLDTGVFSLVSASERTEMIGTLSGRQINIDGYIVKYRVRIANGAVEGEHEAKLKYRIDGGAWREPAPFIVSVRDPRPLLAITKVMSVPEKVSPGKEATFTLTIENLASKDMKDIRVNLGLVMIRAATTSITVEELPFSPIGTTNEIIIEHLASRAIKEVSFRLLTEATAESKVYKIPTTITYSDYSEGNYSTSGYASFVIQSEPDLTVTVEGNTITAPGQRGTISLKFVNKGIDDIKFLNVKLRSHDHYTTLSPEEVYVGNIDSDDYETEDFELLLSDDCCEESGKIFLPLELSYKDDANQDYEIVLDDLAFTVYSEEEREALGLDDGDSKTGIIIVVLIVAVGLVVYYLMRKRKRAKKK